MVAIVLDIPNAYITEWWRKEPILTMYFAYFAIIELPVVTQEQSALNGKNSKTIY